MAGICSVCNVVCDKNAESVKCAGECGQHYHIKCVSVQPDYIKTRAAKKEWYCDACKKGKNTSSTGSSKSSATSTSLTKEFLVSMMEGFKAEIFGELKNYAKQFEEFKHSVEFLSEAIDKSNKNMESISKQFIEMKEENNQLREANGILTKQVKDLQLRMRSMEQYSRNSNIEISGIPQTQGENIQSIVEDVGKTINMEVKCGDIVAAHRVPSFRKERTPQIVVQFHSRVLKTTWLEKYKSAKKDNNGLTAKNVNSNFPSINMYINEHLTPENKMLLHKTKEKCKNANYKYTWCREGKIFVRKTDGIGCFRIVDEDDLAKIH